MEAFNPDDFLLFLLSDPMNWRWNEITISKVRKLGLSNSASKLVVFRKKYLFRQVVASGGTANEHIAQLNCSESYYYRLRKKYLDELFILESGSQTRNYVEGSTNSIFNDEVISENIPQNCEDTEMNEFAEEIFDFDQISADQEQNLIDSSRVTLFRPIEQSNAQDTGSLEELHMVLSHFNSTMNRRLFIDCVLLGVSRSNVESVKGFTRMFDKFKSEEFEKIFEKPEISIRNFFPDESVTRSFEEYVPSLWAMNDTDRTQQILYPRRAISFENLKCPGPLGNVQTIQEVDIDSFIYVGKIPEDLEENLTWFPCPSPTSGITTTNHIYMRHGKEISLSRIPNVEVANFGERGEIRLLFFFPDAMERTNCKNLL